VTDRQSTAEPPVPLPFRPGPRTGEGTDDYIRRLALANHLQPSYLRGYLCGPPSYRHGHPRPDRLTTMTGRTFNQLGRALTDLTPSRLRPKQRSVAARQKLVRARAAEKQQLFKDIRRAVQTEGLSQRQLAERFHIGKRIIRQALESPVPPARKPLPQRTRSLAPHHHVIDALLAHRPRPTTTAIWMHLFDHHASTASYAVVRDYVAHRLDHMARLQ
jgi:predicted XRE-type DNA-binding protein